MARMMKLAGLPILVALCGCGDGGLGSSDQVPVFEVTGKISMAGAPVPNAVVTFSPEGKQPIAMGRTDNEGVYNLTTYSPGDGAAAGDYKVMVSKTAAPASSGVTSAHDANNPAGSTVNMEAMHRASQTSTGETQSDSLLPEKYGSKGSTDLTATVSEGGANRFEFDLSP